MESDEAFIWQVHNKFTSSWNCTWRDSRRGSTSKAISGTILTHVALYTRQCWTAQGVLDRHTNQWKQQAHERRIANQRAGESVCIADCACGRCKVVEFQVGVSRVYEGEGVNLALGIWSARLRFVILGLLTHVATDWYSLRISLADQSNIISSFGERVHVWTLVPIGWNHFMAGCVDQIVVVAGDGKERL